MNWSELNIDTRRRTSGKVKTKCPKCSHTRKKKNDPCLYVDLDSGQYECFNSDCNFKGGINSGKSRTFEREYTQPKFNNKTDLPEAAIKWFMGRGISQDVVNEFKITYDKEYMPQVKGERGTIQFNYFRDSTLVNVKYRDAEKNFKLTSGAELILYNLDAIKDSDECLIAEGEMDALAWRQAGYKFATSVPNGATTGNANIEYLSNSWDYLKNKKKIYIATDNDEAGENLKNELVKRLGKDICYVINIPKEDGVKDSNDYLLKYTSEALVNLMENAEGFPLDDVFTVDDVRDLMMRKYDGELEDKAEKCYFEELEPHWGWNRGEINVFYGGGNMGKSSFSNELCLLKSIKDSDKWGYFSPENHPAADFFNDFAKKYIGTQKYWLEEREKYVEALDFTNDHFYFVYGEDKNHDEDFIFDKFKEVIIRHGIDGIIIDPFNQVESKNMKMRDDQKISQFCNKLKKFLLKHDLFCIIVVHTSTMDKKESGELRMPHMYGNLEGGRMWSKKADNIVCYHRPLMAINSKDTSAIVQVQKIKKKWKTGEPGEIDVRYSLDTNRFYDVNNKTAFSEDDVYNPYGGLEVPRDLEDDTIPF